MKRRRFTELSDEDVLIPWLIIILLGGLSVAGLIRLREPAKTAEEVTSAAPATKVDVETTVEAAAALMPDLIVTSQPVPVIERDPTETVLTYLVEAKKTNEYWFEVADYRLFKGGDWSSLGVEEFHRALDRAYEKRTPFPDEIKVSLSATLGKEPVSLGGGLEMPAKTIGQALGLIHGVVKLNVARVDVAIKGYADGEKAPGWAPPVGELPEDFRTFPVLRATDESKDNWLFYDDTQHERRVAYPYTNEDLPDLRARYIQRQFVELLVPKSRNADRCHVYVLHNKPLPGPDQAEWRKAQIYVMVYLERETKPRRAAHVPRHDQGRTHVRRGDGETPRSAAVHGVKLKRSPVTPHDRRVPVGPA